MSAKIKYIARTAVININTANTFLDGTGAMGSLITGSNDGTRIDVICIKATNATSQGMVRFFTNHGTNTSLYREVCVPETNPSGITKSFEIVFSDGLLLEPGDSLFVSTQNSDSFNIIAYCNDILNCPCSSHPLDFASTTKNVANTGLVTISTANTNRDGTGSISTLITAPVSADGGTQIDMVVVKSIQKTTLGMIRFFVNNGVSNFLMREIVVPGMSPSNVNPSFRASTYFGFPLQSGFSLNVSTQNSESFNIIADGINQTNCTC